MSTSKGKGKLYREEKEGDLRPDYERMMKWVKRKR